MLPIIEPFVIASSLLQKHKEKFPLLDVDWYVVYLVGIGSCIGCWGLQYIGNNLEWKRGHDFDQSTI